jgi:hypothetical protein
VTGVIFNWFKKTFFPVIPMLFTASTAGKNIFLNQLKILPVTLKICKKPKFMKNLSLQESEFI